MDPLQDPYAQAQQQGPFLTGLRQGTLGIGAGATALGSDIAEGLRLKPIANALRQYSADLSAQAARVTPEEYTYKRVLSGELSPVDYAAYALGQNIPSMAASIGGGVAARALRRNPYVGAFAPAAVMEAGETASDLQQDPATAALPVSQRLGAEAVRGVVGGAAEAAVPAALVRPLKAAGVKPRLGPVTGAVGGFVAEGATEAAQQKLGQEIHSFLNNARDRTKDTDELIDSFLMGGVPGGALGGVRGTLSKALDSKPDIGVVKKPTPEEGLGMGDRDPRMLAALQAGDQAGVAALDKERGAVAGELLKRDPDLAKQFAGADLSDPLVQAEIGQTHARARRAEELPKMIEDFTGKSKKNRQSTGAIYSSPLIDMLAGQLKPEYTELVTPEQLGTIAKKIGDILGDEKLSESEIVEWSQSDTARRLLENMFQDPADVVNTALKAVGAERLAKLDKSQENYKDEADKLKRTQQHLEEIFASHRSAETDSQTKGSLFNTIVANKNLGPDERRQVGRFIDRYIDKGAPHPHKVVLKELAKIFGDETRAEQVLAYYETKRVKPSRDDSGTSIAQPSLDRSDEQDTRLLDFEELRDAEKQPEPTMNMLFADTLHAMPFRKGEAPKDAGRVMSMLDYVNENKLDPQREADRIFYRLKELKDKSPAAAAEYEAAGKTKGARELLSMYEAVQQPSEQADTGVASARDMKSMRLLLDTSSGHKVDSKIEFMTGDGKKFALSAESMWKTMAEKNSERPTNEVDRPEQIKRWFASAVAAVMARPEMKGGYMFDSETGTQNEIRDDLVIDRGLKITGKDLKGRAKEGDPRAEELRLKLRDLRFQLLEAGGKSPTIEQDIAETLSALRASHREQASLQAHEAQQAKEIELNRKERSMKDTVDELKNRQTLREQDPEGERKFDEVTAKVIDPRNKPIAKPEAKAPSPGPNTRFTFLDAEGNEVLTQELRDQTKAFFNDYTGTPAQNARVSGARNVQILRELTALAMDRLQAAPRHENTDAWLRLVALSRERIARLTRSTDMATRMVAQRAEKKANDELDKALGAVRKVAERGKAAENPATREAAVNVLAALGLADLATQEKQLLVAQVNDKNFVRNRENNRKAVLEILDKRGLVPPKPTFGEAKVDVSGRKDIPEMGADQPKVGTAPSRLDKVVLKPTKGDEIGSQARAEHQAELGKRRLNAMSVELARELDKKGIAAAHVSPVRHAGKFDWRSHQGKGQSKAAFGAGLYLSTSEGVQKFYKNLFTAQLEAGKTAPTYHVVINARQTELMDWDAELLDQPAAVERAVEASGVETQSNWTGEQFYNALADKLGSQEEASNFLQKHGVVGHKYQDQTIKSKAQPNYVIYDDSRVETNYVELNKQNLDNAAGMSGATEDQILSEARKILGPQIKASFEKNLGSAGEFFVDEKTNDEVIRLAVEMTTGMAREVMHHEATHAFMARLMGTKSMRATREMLMNVGNTPAVVAQLRQLLANHPNALAQLDDREERVAYMFQFWMAGKLTLPKPPATFFQKVLAFIRDVIGVVTQYEKAEALMAAFADGKFANRVTTGAVLADMRQMTFAEKADKFAPMLKEYGDKLMLGATDRLRKFNTDATTWLSDKFFREPDREEGGLGFIQRRSQQTGIFRNKLADILEGTTAEQRALAIHNLQSMQAPSSELEKKLASLLSEIYDYMKADPKNPVQRFDLESKEWRPLGFVKNYFPRVWDKATIRNNQQEFIDLIMKHGHLSATQAQEVVTHILHSIGDPQLVEGKGTVGFTPFAQSIAQRKLDFINPNNAADFVKFQSKDMTDIVDTYIYQAVHRTEYARDFGNDGEVIKAALDQAEKQGMTSTERAEAEKVVMALEGTIGYDMNPRTRDLFASLVTYQNIVLLPFALFASLIDPLGIALRSGDIKEAWTAFQRGISDILAEFTKDGVKDPDRELARTLGLIDSQNMLENYGNLQHSMYMSSFLKNVNNKFFRWNGMEGWNNSMRIAAMISAQRFIVRNRNHDRYMKELGITSKDVIELPDGRIATSQDEGLSAESEKRIREAIFKFVDGGVLRPNAAHRAVWMSDPHWMLFAHLKQFTYSFHSTIMRRMTHEVNNGNSMAMAIYASYIPFMIAADLVRGGLTGSGVKGGWDLMDYIGHGIERSAILGKGQFLVDAWQDAAWGKTPGTSLLGPAIEHGTKAVGWAAGSVGGETLFYRSMPAGPLLRAALE